MNNLGDLLPAYGRDYKTAKEAKESFNRGDDWIISSMFHPNSGSYINITDIINAGGKGKTFILRFSNKRKIASVRVK